MLLVTYGRYSNTNSQERNFEEKIITKFFVFVFYIGLL